MSSLSHNNTSTQSAAANQEAPSSATTTTTTTTAATKKRNVLNVTDDKNNNKGKRSIKIREKKKSIFIYLNREKKNTTNERYRSIAIFFLPQFISPRYLLLFYLVAACLHAFQAYNQSNIYPRYEYIYEGKKVK